MNTWATDSEFGFHGGDSHESGFTPVVFCLANVGTGQRLAFWGRDPRLADFLRDHGGDTFLAHNIIAEVKFLLRLGIRPPLRWWDTMLGHRYQTNQETYFPFDLVSSLKHHGLAHGFASECKEDLQERIGELRFDRDDPGELTTIREYCFCDAQASADLYVRQRQHVPAVWMNWATMFALALARMELRGIGVDMPVYNAILEHREEICRVLSNDINQIYPVFPDGKFSKPAFFGWCKKVGIGWPLTWSREKKRKILSVDDDVMKLMERRHPFIAQVRQTKKTLNQLNNRTLAVDPVKGRHYFGNIPFGASSGRTTFRGFLLSCPKWMRYLAVPTSPEHLLISVDFDAEEICLAAWQSGDLAMLAGYESGDPHINFAILAGAAPLGATRTTHGKIRAAYKAINLGTNYGRTARGFADETGLHVQTCQRIINQHKRNYATYWRWTSAYVASAYKNRRCWTLAGWPKKVRRHDNYRSICNFPVQGLGGDLMRLVVILLERRGLQLLATNHDGFLLECRREDRERTLQAIDEVLRTACNLLIPGAPMKWTTEFLETRYEDPDGRPLWDRVQEILANLAAGRAGAEKTPVAATREFSLM
jgi:hypothetical protein